MCVLVENHIQSLAREIGAKRYVECSALTRAGLAEAVEGAVAAVLPDVKAGEMLSTFNEFICLEYVILKRLFMYYVQR